MPSDNTSRKIPSVLNGLILSVQTCAFFLLVLVARRCEGPWALTFLALGFSLLMNSAYYVMHEAQHGMLFQNRNINDWAGSFITLWFPASFHLLRQGHLGHHMRNRSDDEAFDYYFHEDHKLWRFMVLYGILTGFFYLMVLLSNIIFLLAPFAMNQKYWQLDRPSKALISSLNPRYRRVIQFECLLAILFHATIIFIFSIPWVNYAIMYGAFGLSWSAMQYVHHFGTERDVTKGARNSYLCKPIDLLWLNHNWHLTHHQHPTVPWIYLPELGKKQTAPRTFLLTAYLRMWKGPKKTSHRVQNKYAGRIIH